MGRRGVCPPFSLPNVPWVFSGLNNHIVQSNAHHNSPLVGNPLSSNVRFPIHVPIRRAWRIRKSNAARQLQRSLHVQSVLSVRCTVAPKINKNDATISSRYSNVGLKMDVGKVSMRSRGPASDSRNVTHNTQTRKQTHRMLVMRPTTSLLQTTDNSVASALRPYAGPRLERILCRCRVPQAPPDKP
jgi:hypothetical protein